MRHVLVIVALVGCGAKPVAPAASESARQDCYSKCLELGPSSGGQGERSETWASMSNADKDEACKADYADAK